MIPEYISKRWPVTITDSRLSLYWCSSYHISIFKHARKSRPLIKMQSGSQSKLQPTSFRCRMHGRLTQLSPTKCRSLHLPFPNSTYPLNKVRLRVNSLSSIPVSCTAKNPRSRILNLRSIITVVSFISVITLIIHRRTSFVFEWPYLSLYPTTHRGSSLVRLILSEVNGGTIYKIPESCNRFQTPWIERSRVKLLSPGESNFRYLYSPVRKGSSDGIGHSMGVVNLDLNLAIRFNLTYTHRVADYSSLTKNDKSAVENFFGWGDGEIPRTFIQKEGCISLNQSWPSTTNLYDCFQCDTVRYSGALGIKHLVNIPSNLSSRCPLRATCSGDTTEFLLRHPHPNTIFQVPQPTCAAPSTDGSLIHTKNFFYHKYWNRHGTLVWSESKRKPSLRVRYSESELNIAIHVRRGDFLDPETRRTDDLIHDETFAVALQNVLVGFRQVGGPFSKLPIAVHIYSEGKLMRHQVPSTHDMDEQDKMYYDSKGHPQNTSWWEHLILNRGHLKGRQGAAFVKNRLRFIHHISEDTLLSAHEMIAADVFIGSKSAMSLHLVWSIAKGIVVVPRSGMFGTELTHFGLLCCTVPFSQGNGNFSLSLFRRYWDAYTKANEATVRRFVN